MTDLDRFGEKAVDLRKQRFQMWHFQMSIQISLAPPVLVEDEYAGIFGIDVKIIIYAAGLGARGLHLLSQ
jgi:hypothetical protein